MSFVVILLLVLVYKTAVGIWCYYPLKHAHYLNYINLSNPLLQDLEQNYVIIYSLIPRPLPVFNVAHQITDYEFVHILILTVVQTLLLSL